MAMSRAIRVPVPKTRDPFINTPLIPAGTDDAGHERFWISTWNHLVGCLGVLISETGAARLYHFAEPREPGFYSAVAEDNDTLWLCGGLSHVVRLDLRSGKYEAFDTGAPDALVFQGMILDRATGKLFAAAFPGEKTTAFSFDYRRRRPVKVHTVACPEKYARFSFPNGDGTWSMVLHIPGEAFLRWDPRRERVSASTFAPEMDAENCGHGTTYSLVDDGAGRWYVPRRGWFDPETQRFAADGPRPQQEMTWFARRGALAWGANAENGSTRVGLWDMRSGKVRELCTVADTILHGINLTADGKLVAVTIYGVFLRFDGHTGALEVSRRLDADSYGAVDCLCRIDRDRLLGTPFITQRFWVANLRSGRGEDCGRAAPGGGEVLQTWNLNGRIYMAAYGGGELVEFDPDRPARFPENPRVVADPPGAMRPVAAADDGRRLFYSSSAEYGKLGSVVARYDTLTGETSHKADPLPRQQINSLGYDAEHKLLVAGSTMHADCRSAVPATNQCFFAALDPESLAVVKKAAAPPGTLTACVIGALGPGKWLCSCSGMPEHTPWFILDLDKFRLPRVRDMKSLAPGLRCILRPGRPGFFVVQKGRNIELWDWRGAEPRRVLVLARNFRGYRLEADRDSVYLLYPRHITVLDGCLDAQV